VSFLGIDIGTTGVKAAVYGTDGRKLAHAFEACACAVIGQGRVEAEADRWWDAVVKTCAELATRVPLLDVEAIGVVGQAPTAVLLDAEGQAVRPAIVWLDVRASDEAASLEKELGPGVAEAVHGNRMHPYYLGPKLAWLGRHERSSLERARVLLQSHAFVVMRLTGEAACDASTAMLSTPLYDPSTQAWSERGAHVVGLDPALLPRLTRAEEIVGEVTRRAAEATGLREGTPVVAGGGDFAATALGAGVLEEGQACLMLGTAGNLLMPRNAARFDGRLINSHHVGCERWLALGGTLCGAALEWFRGACAPGVDWDTLEREAASVEVGAAGVVMLPYLLGERTPVWDEKVRGAFFGLDVGHGRAHLYRALLEGIALGFRDCLSVVEDQGVRFREVVASNGAGRSALLRQALADALETPVSWAPESDATVAGAAKLAAIGASPRHGSRWHALGHAGVRHEPDAHASARLQGVLAKRRAFYAATVSMRS
jgi:xylulokinase